METLHRNGGLRGDQRRTKEEFSVSAFHSDRSLGEAEVELYGEGGVGTCLIRNSLDTLYSGEVAASGAVFTVKALSSSIEIQGIEFANVNADDDSTVQIYVRQGTSFSSNKVDWTQLATTTSVRSPDGLGAIVPRADMTAGVTMTQGDERTFYISLGSNNLKMADSSASSGSAFQSDDYLQLNVGESVAAGAEFSASRTPNRAFQGKLHYRVIKPCNTLTTETKLVFPFAAEPATDAQKLNDAVSAGFNKLLTDEADLARWTTAYGLKINSLTLKSKGTLDNCAEHGFKNGCDLFDSDLTLGHYQSLSPNELTLDFMVKLDARNGLGELENSLSVVYIGDQVLNQTYDVTINGVPTDTLLVPLQREYLEKVTLDFIDEFSEAQALGVDIQQILDGQRLLRGGFKDSTLDERHLQAKEEAPSGKVKVEAIVFGIGSDRKKFTSEVEKAIVKNTAQYKEEVQKRQYLPGTINDGTNFGNIFEDIVGITVKQGGTTKPTTTTEATNEMDKTQIQIIAFSVGLGISFLVLFYRVMKDCVLVKDGWAIKKEKLSDKVDRENAKYDRPELANMDKPRQRVSTAVDINALKELKLKSSGDDSTVATKESTQRRGRKPPTSRGVGRAKSNDDVDFFGSSNTRAEPTRGVARTKSGDSTELFRRGEPTRGVARTTSADASLLFGSRSAHGRPDPLANKQDPLASRSFHGRPEPESRGVGRAKSNDDLDLGRSKPLSSLSSHGRVEPSRTVARSKSSELMEMFGVRGRAGGETGQPEQARGRPAPATRGVQKSNTFGGVEGLIGGGAQKRPSFLSGGKKNSGNETDTTTSSAKSASTTESGTKKKGKKKKKAANGEASPATKKKKKTKSASAKSMDSKSSDTSDGSKGSGKKKKKATAEKGTTKKKKKNSLENSALPGVPNGRPPPPPKRVDMSGPH